MRRSLQEESPDRQKEAIEFDAVAPTPPASRTTQRSIRGDGKPADLSNSADTLNNNSSGNRQHPRHPICSACLVLYALDRQTGFLKSTLLGAESSSCPQHLPRPRPLLFPTFYETALTELRVSQHTFLGHPLRAHRPPTCPLAHPNNTHRLAQNSKYASSGLSCQCPGEFAGALIRAVVHGALLLASGQ